MSKFVSTFQKPLPHISLAEWYAKQWELEEGTEARRSEAYRLRNTGRVVRCEGTTRTKWDTYINNTRLVDRITELSRWKEIFEDLLQRLVNEICLLNDEKINMERESENISRPLQLVSECLSMRDGRRRTELTYDEADMELKKELCVLGNLEMDLTKRAQAMWEKLKHLEAVKFELMAEIDNKNESIDIDKKNLKLDYAHATTSYKPSALTTEGIKYVDYETWLNRCHCMKILINKEIDDCYTFRETMRVAREHVWNDIKAQQDLTDYTLRKRIHQTQKSRNDMEWQKLRIEKEMEVMTKEINEGERALMVTIMDPLKCAETRLDNRVYRPKTERCNDEVETGLRKEAMQLIQTENDLTKALESTKASFNSLESLLKHIVVNLEDKQQSINTDVMCLNMRMPKAAESLTNEIINRNLMLNGLENTSTEY